jgi:hypothetical protein
MSEPKPVRCWHCDFASGYRGMDSCGKCKGTGSLLAFNGEWYPNTKEGYEDALRAGGGER